MGFQDAIRSCLTRYADFAGRAPRAEFWFFWLFNLLAQLAASLLDAGVFGGARVVNGFVWLALLLPSLAVAARRLHDTGRSAWWLLVGLVPLLGGILLIWWFIQPGEAGANRFGQGRGAGPGGGFGGGPPPASPRGGPDRPWSVSRPPRS